MNTNELKDKAKKFYNEHQMLIGYVAGIAVFAIGDYAAIKISNYLTTIPKGAHCYAEIKALTDKNVVSIMTAGATRLGRYRIMSGVMTTADEAINIAAQLVDAASKLTPGADISITNF